MNGSTKKGLLAGFAIATAVIVAVIAYRAYMNANGKQPKQ